MRDKHLTMREVVPHLIKNEGYLSLYKGITATLLRDVPGWGIYFYSYEVLKQWAAIFNKRYSTSYRHPQSAEVFTKILAGGIAGCLSWLVSYPMDIIKTHIQVNPERVAPRIRDVVMT